MIWRVAVTLACTLAAQGAAHAEPLVAIVRADDVRRSILVGPSGQLWEPDGQGTWSRRIAGGVAADVTGAARVAELGLILAGRATPLYRRDGEIWRTFRLGERGRTLVGDGPRPALAIGRTIFVHAAGQWKRVAFSPRIVTGLWAASHVRVYVASDGGIARLVGARFVPHATTPIRAFGAGPSPWAVTADGAVLDVTTRRVHRPAVAGAQVDVALVSAAPDGSVWALGHTASGPALVRLRKGVWAAVPAPPLTPDDPAIALAADRTGALLIATRAGAVHLGAPDGSWTRGMLTDSLPAPHAGPRPARTR